MDRKSLYPLNLLLFWIVLFNIFRIIFFFINTSQSAASLNGFYHGFRLDIATALYLMIPSLVVWIILMYFKKSKKVYLWFLLPLNILLFIVVSIIEAASIPLFKEWGTTFNLRAFEYFLSSKEAWQTIAEFSSFTQIILLLILMAAGIIVLTFIHTTGTTKFTNKWAITAVALIICLSTFYGVRGGLSKIPLKISASFYSNIQSNNYLAVNKSFYFINSLMKKRKLNIEDECFSNEVLTKLYDKLYSNRHAGEKIELLDSKRPNIVLIILEGCQADIFKPLGGIDSVTPTFSNLCKEGLLFNNIYSSGFRTDQGILNILSGVPALPYLNILGDVEISRKFPSILKTLKKNAYKTSFIMGGNLEFSNLKYYLINNETDLIIGDDDFKSKERTISWGVSDNLLFNRAEKEIGAQQQPFFSCILTQNTHPPFDYKFKHKFPGKNTPELYKSTAFFTDSCIGDFIQNCKSQPWYKNTLFVITSDHGSLYLGNRDFNDHRRFQIPLLMWGSPLKAEFRGKEISSLGNHSDFPSTLLSQLDIADDEYIFSKNLLVNGDNYFHAYWITEQTLGWVTDTQKIVMNHETRELFFEEVKNMDNSTYTADAMAFYKLVANYVLVKEKVDVAKSKNYN